jgi:hypothetical protein
MELPHQRRTRRYMLMALACLVLLGGAGFAVYQLRGKPAMATEPTDDPIADNDPRVGRRRALYKDNGEMIVQAMVPDPLIAGQEIRSRLEIKNKLGQPIVAEEIVLTIADDTGAAKGLTARPRPSRENPKITTAATGRYYFRYTFPKAGRYTLRVFPPSIDSSFEIPVDVQ